MEDKQGSSNEQGKTEPTPPPPPATVPTADIPPVPPIAGQGAASPGSKEQSYDLRPLGEDKFTKNDKVMMWLTGVIALGTLVSAVAIFMQWREMVGGGKQTDQIIEAANINACAARKSAQAAKDFADSTAKISVGIGDAVNKLNTQAQQTRELSQTSKDTLHISERAYLEVGIGAFDISGKTLRLPITNSGHIPSGRGKMTVHEETLDMSLFSATHNAFVVERHWTEDEFNALAPGNPTNDVVTLPNLDGDQFTTGRQKIIVTGVVTYNDGFSGTSEQRWSFCISSDVRLGAQTASLFPCNANEQLPIAIAHDEYPSPKYHRAN
jgi:hypothetical protein